MPLFDKDGHKVHYIHVPRTGGRYVSKLFEYNKFNTRHSTLNVNDNFDGILCIHFYYPLYKMFEDYDERVEFCIIRNPFDKFISSITHMSNYFSRDYNFIIKNQEIFDNFIMNEICQGSRHNSWFLEQHKFVSEKTKVWKYEDGFGKKFVKWIDKNFSIKLDIPNRVSYDQNLWSSYNENVSTKKYKFNNMFLARKRVKNFYKKDYEIFKYWY